MRYHYRMGVVRIYGIVDPRNGEVRYVGKTSESYARRLRGHYAASRKRHTPVGHWLAKLEELGLRSSITFITLEEQPLDWKAAERRWIAHYRWLYPGKMKNVTDGGEGGDTRLVKTSKVERIPRSIDDKRAHAAAIAKLPRKGAPWSEERKAAQSARWLARRTS